MEGLCGLMHDSDRDVRESAVVALGQICDPRAIYPLVLALLDPESSVRNAAVNSLPKLDRRWEKSKGAQQALPEITAALNHRDYWIRNCAVKLLEQIKVDPKSVDSSPSPVIPLSPAADVPSSSLVIMAAASHDADPQVQMTAPTVPPGVFIPT